MRDATVRSRSPTGEPNPRQQPDVQAREGVESLIPDLEAGADGAGVENVMTLLPVAAVAAILVMGAVASAALFRPGTLSFPTRVASCFALGYAVVTLVATALALVHLVVAWALAAGLLATTAAMAACAARRGGLRSGLRREVGADRALLALGGAVVVAIAVARAGVPVNAGAGGWRYWADGLEIATAGHEPAHTLQWGVLTTPAISKIGGNAYNAALSLSLGPHPFSAMAVSLWLSAVGLAAALWALAWELGLRFSAPLVPLSCLTIHVWPGGLVVGEDLVRKLQFFQNEDAGRMCAVAAAALAVPVVRSGGGRRRALVCGAVLGAAALTHLIPVLVAGIFIVAYAVAVGVADRSPLPPLATLGIIAGVALAITVGSLVAARGDVGFGGASGGGYSLFMGRDDPTLALLGRRSPPRPKSEHRFYTPPSAVAEHYVEAATLLRGSGGPLLAISLVVAALVAVACVLGGRDERIAVGVSIGTAVCLLLIGLAMSFRYSYYVQATFGDRRLFEYGGIPLVLVGAAALSPVLARLASVTPRLPVLSAAGLVVVVVLAVGTNGLGGGLRTGRPHNGYLEAARVATPCNSRLLTPSMTRGSFQALTGRASIREGLMAFLRPDVLARSLAIERGANRFYRSPSTQSGFLASQDVDYVLAPVTMETRLDRAPGLSRTAEVDGVAVYRVYSPLAGDAARPAQAAGYVCVSEPLR
jgi:hypothetical protein